METPAIMGARLLAALADLIEQEGAYLRAGLYDPVVANRRRTGPLVSQLVAMAGLPGVQELRPLVEAAVARSEAHAACLRDKIQETAAELKRVEQARFFTAQVAPAYLQAKRTGNPRFRAAG